MCDTRGLPRVRQGVLAASLAALVVCPGLADAHQGQAVSTLVTTVTDTLGAPLELATVLLHQARMRGTTGPTGRVILRQVPPGVDTVLVRRIGYVPVAVEVRFAPGDTVRIDAILEPKPLALNDIVVTGRRGLTTFERRRRSAVFSPPNSFLTPEWLDTFPPRLAVSEILRKVGIIYRLFGIQRRLACPPGPFGGGSAPVEILLNGGYYPDREGDFLEAMKRMEVRAIEVYRSDLEVPYELPMVMGEDMRMRGLSCVVVIWTR